MEEVHLALAAHATGLIRLRDDGRLEQAAGVGAFEHLGDHTMPAHHGLVGALPARAAASCWSGT